MKKQSSVVVVGALSVLLAACGGGEPLPNRQTVDPAMVLLYPEARFAGAGVFTDLEVDSPAHKFDQPGVPRAGVKRWAGLGPTVRELAMIHDDANDAAKFFTKRDPREERLALLTPDNTVGESQSYDAPGRPDSSQIFCDTLRFPDSDQCETWTWWARYGQYTFEINAGLDVGGPTIDRAQFEELVDLAAAHISEMVGP